MVRRWLLPKVVPTLDSLAWDLLTKDLRLWTSLHNWSQDLAKKSSYKEHRVDALAPYAEEGRGKLRKATGSRKQALNRGYPNGETRQAKSLSP